MKIAIQGVKGAFHEKAARKYFVNQQIDIVEKMTFEETLDSVVDFESDYALMAIENTISGTIHANLNLLKTKDVKICGEIFIRITQNLAVLPGVKIEDLIEVRSHYMAINQTRQFFRRYPYIKLVESEDTALSLKQVAEEKLTNVGAIGSDIAAQMYGLEIIATGIETNKKNYTRFLVVQRSAENIADQFNKASLNVVLQNKVGSLAQILSVISFYDMDLTKLESVPIIGQPLSYMFYIDVCFNDIAKYRNMLNAIRPLLRELNILGEYQSGDKSMQDIHRQ